ncbi:MAG TPA: BON domain-containing protein [Verrucomicrobiae bacterium]|jgi:hypothetical protein|nr:BON domain-containing protein [Verrucomicrobiae bacterium]
MKNATIFLVVSALCALTACSKNSGDKAASAKGQEQANRFGSATDIIPANNPNLPTNNNNRADNGLGGPANRESGNYKSTRSAPNNSDRELAKQIKVALTTGSTGTTGAIAENQLTRIDVQVQNGQVTLNGPVSTEKEKKTIEKQVAGFKGVQSVQNNLTVGARNVQDKPLEPLVPRTPGNE